MMEQEPLPFTDHDDKRREESDDALILTPLIKEMLAGLNNLAYSRYRTGLLIGPARSGKTIISRYYAGQNDGAVIVDDADKVAGDDAAEERLFHLWNKVQGNNSVLLLTSSQPGEKWGLRLPDLVSRLSAAHITLIPPVDETMIAALITKYVNKYGMMVPPSTVQYLAARIERRHDIVEQAGKLLVEASERTGNVPGLKSARFVLSQLETFSKEEST